MKNKNKNMKVLSVKQEVWRDIEGYEGRYQISSFGRVKSLERYEPTIVKGTQCIRLTKGRILKQQINRYGYAYVCIKKRGEKRQKNIMIHKLVGSAFIEKPDGCDQINHIDENKLNNRFDNLEWCNVQYNLSYGNHNRNVSAALKGKKKSDSHRKKIIDTRIKKPVVKIDKETLFVLKIYPSMREAERDTGIFLSSISACCKGIVKTAGGFIWKLKNAI